MLLQHLLKAWRKSCRTFIKWTKHLEHITPLLSAACIIVLNACYAVYDDPYERNAATRPSASCDSYYYIRFHMWTNELKRIYNR
jgi:hypothetical protein